jgi:AcrR family transcriptional regulator
MQEGQAISEQLAPKKRRDLNRNRVVRAAVELADLNGIESLSMRKVAEAVGFEAMSLYNHVTDKDDLLDGMVDMIFSEIDLPSTSETDWMSAMRQRALSAREVLTRHRWAIGLIDSRTSPGPATMKHFDAALGCLRDGGFSIEMTVRAYGVIYGYVYGFVLAFNQDTISIQAEQILDHAPPETYPHATEITSYMLQHGFDYLREFENGLDLILDGLEPKSGRSTQQR